MELNITERLLILNLDTLPKVGNIITMRTKQQLMTDIGFTEEEIKEANLITGEEGKVMWDKDFSKDIPIGESALKLIIDAIDKSQNVHELYIPLYDKLKDVA